MGAVDCPICEQTRHIADYDDVDRCWACGWPVPIYKSGPRAGEFKDKVDWPPVGEQERRDRKRHAEKRGLL